METNKKLLKVSINILLYSTLLFFFVYFFMQDQMSAYIKKRTTVTKHGEEAKELEYPTVTICLNPYTKLSVSKQFGYKSTHDKLGMDFPNLTLHERYDELTYQLNRDFFLHNYYGEKIQIGVNSIKEFINEDTLRIIEVQRLRTFLRGTCYKLEPKFEVLYVPFRLRFRVTLNSSLPTSDMPKSVSLIFTSNKSWIGIPEEMWPQSKPVSQNVDFIKERTNVYVNANEKYFEEGIEDHHECVKNYYLKRNCSYLCSTFGAVSGLPPCLRPEQHRCMWNDWKSGNGKSLYNCYKSKKVTSYKLDTIEDPPHTDLNATSTDIYIGIFSMYKTIEEEVPILTLPDLIGSIGGSLGLFFGFSISATLFYCGDLFFYLSHTYRECRSGIR